MFCVVCQASFENQKSMGRMGRVAKGNMLAAVRFDRTALGLWALHSSSELRCFSCIKFGRPSCLSVE